MRFNGSDYDHQRDSQRLTNQFQRVSSLMQDGEWRSLRNISDTTGDPESSVSAQLRHMRKERFGSHTVEKKHEGGGLYLYRVLIEEQQLSLEGLEHCPAGHKMSTNNLYWYNKHGHPYAVCRQCEQGQDKEPKKPWNKFFTQQDQQKIARMPVVKEDISQITACPKCEGILKWGEDTRLEDKVSCVYCGWRPSAKLAMEL